jgi:hypothetical protein
MSLMTKKSAAQAAAALSCALCFVASAAPALADPQGYGAGPGYAYPVYGWHGGYYDWMGPVGAALDNNFAAGELMSRAYGRAQAYYPSYDNCYWQNRPAYDSLGSFYGYYPVLACY